MKEIWSIDLETSLVGLTFDGFESQWQTAPDNAGSRADELILHIYAQPLIYSEFKF